MVVVCVSGQTGWVMGSVAGAGPEEEGGETQDLSVAVVSCGAQHPAMPARHPRLRLWL